MKLNVAKLLDSWNKVKKKLQANANQPFFKEGEIWWCGVGQNLGTEIYGKSKNFSRPVLIYRKLNKRSFLGICLTSKRHIGSWYVRFRFKGKDEYANLAQTRAMSTYRMYTKMGEIDEKDMEKVVEGFYRLYCKGRRKNVLKPFGLRLWEIPKNLYSYCTKLFHKAQDFLRRFFANPTP